MNKAQCTSLVDSDAKVELNVILLFSRQIFCNPHLMDAGAPTANAHGSTSFPVGPIDPDAGIGFEPEESSEDEERLRKRGAVKSEALDINLEIMSVVTIDKKGLEIARAQARTQKPKQLNKAEQQLRALPWTMAIVITINMVILSYLYFPPFKDPMVLSRFKDTQIAVINADQGSSGLNFGCMQSSIHHC